MTRRLRLILHGNKATPVVRDAVTRVRDLGHDVDVRVTWEAHDAVRFATDADDDGVDVVVAGGGDGTVHEVINGLCADDRRPSSALAVLPLGTANDFANGCGVPMNDPTAALTLAAEGRPTPIDVGWINGRWFLNAVVVGFGAEVTMSTSESLKSSVGGIAYALQGMLLMANDPTYSRRFTWDDGRSEADVLMATIANGTMAGQTVVAPRASLTDGRLDLVEIPNFTTSEFPAFLRESQNLATEEPQLIRYQQLDGMLVEADEPVPIAVDGELMTAQRLEVRVHPGHVRMVLPGQRE